MRKVDDGEEKEKRKKRKKKEKNGVFSGHYVIASSLPPERRPLERRTLVPIKSTHLFTALDRKTLPKLALTLKLNSNLA